jgi:DNA invertase Pin-like site-specific DNA recombinase
MSKAKDALQPVAYSYVRFSSPEQARGDSLRRQTEAAAEWCKRHDVRLDESTTLRDLGKSAYLGNHRKNPDRHALAAFLKMVESGRVPHGSYLIVENLDRLTREHVRPAVKLWMDLLDAGVNIVTTKPEHLFRHDSNEITDVIIAVVELARGHSESKRKSDMIGSAWSQKRKAAQEGKPQPKLKHGKMEGTMILTRRLPAWIEEHKGRLRLIPARAKVVKHIFKLAASGYGHPRIVAKLIADEVPPFGEKVKKENLPEGRKRSQFAGRWTRSYVSAMLRDRSVVGEFQPRVSDGSRQGKPDGPPIPDYFPAVVTEAEWFAARGGAAQRFNRSANGRPWTEEEDRQVMNLKVDEAAKRFGRTRSAVRCRRAYLRKAAGHSTKREWANRQSAEPDITVNIFKGLLRDARDGGSFYFAQRADSCRVLVNSNAGEGVPCRSFPYRTFERAILECLREIDPHDILNGDSGPDETLALSGELARVEQQIAALEAELLTGDVPALANVARQLENQRKDLAAKLAAARAKAAHPLSETWGEMQTLADALRNAADRTDARLRLRAALRQVIKSIWVVIAHRGKDRLCMVQVYFNRGYEEPSEDMCFARTPHRFYQIIHRPPRSNQHEDAGKFGGYYVASLGDESDPHVRSLGGHIDLRSPEEASMAVAHLENIPTDMIDKMVWKHGNMFP